MAEDGQEQQSEGDGTAPRTFDDFGEYVRFQAAAQANLAETLEQGRRDIMATLAKAKPTSEAEPGTIQIPPLGDLLTSIDEGIQHAKLLSSVHAAQAIAYDHMQANGGPENPEALAEYGTATNFHTELLGIRPTTTDSDEEQPPLSEE